MGGRVKSSLVETDKYFLICMRYIELNPVRAGMVELPSEYRWSSYRANGYGEYAWCITHHPVYSELSKNSHDRLYKYRELFLNALNYDQLHEIRSSLNHELVLGESRFKEKIEAMTNRRVTLGRPGRPKIKECEIFYRVC